MKTSGLHLKSKIKLLFISPGHLQRQIKKEQRHWPIRSPTFGGHLALAVWLRRWSAIRTTSKRGQRKEKKSLPYPSLFRIAMPWSIFVVYAVTSLLQPCLWQYTLQLSSLLPSPHHTSWNEAQDMRVRMCLLWGIGCLRFVVVGIGSAIVL